MGNNLIYSHWTGKNSWFNLTLYEVENQLVDLGKFPGSMNFDEYSQVTSVWNADLIQTSGGNIDDTSTATSFSIRLA